jgi:hypothetical protein
MNFKRALTASTLTAGIGLAGLFGIGLGAANADPGGPCPPGAPCGQHDDHGPGDRGPGGPGGPGDRGPGGPGDHGPGGPGGPDWHDDQGRDWQHRGIDDARRDHQPFNWNGQWINPVFDPGHNGWGFWLGPIWMPF